MPRPKSVDAWAETIKADGKKDAATNARGNQVYRLFCPSERYLIDFSTDFVAEGWEQFDTDQDAAYFGVWMNKRRRWVMSYAEGDWVLVECADWQHYNAEVESYIAFHGEGYIAKVARRGYSDPKTGLPDMAFREYRQARQLFLIDPADPERRQPEVLKALLGG